MKTAVKLLGHFRYLLKTRFPFSHQRTTEELCCRRRSRRTQNGQQQSPLLPPQHHHLRHRDVRDAGAHVLLLQRSRWAEQNERITCWDWSSHARSLFIYFFTGAIRFLFPFTVYIIIVIFCFATASALFSCLDAVLDLIRCGTLRYGPLFFWYYKMQFERCAKQIFFFFTKM